LVTKNGRRLSADYSSLQEALEVALRDSREANKRAKLAERVEGVSLPINPEHDALVDRLVEERVRGTGRALATVPVLALPSVEEVARHMAASTCGKELDHVSGYTRQRWINAANAALDVVRECQPAALLGALQAWRETHDDIRDEAEFCLSQAKPEGIFESAVKLLSAASDFVAPKGYDHE
jgi:hypothetical protein